MSDDQRARYSMTGIPIAPSGPKMRVFTWVIVGINVLFLVWIVSALAHHDTCTSEVTYQDACRTGAAAGTTIAVGVILFICAVVDVILGVLWMVTRKPEGTPGTFGLAVSNPLRSIPDPGPASRAVAIEEGRMCPDGHENRPGARFCDVCGSKVLEPF